VNDFLQYFLVTMCFFDFESFGLVAGDFDKAFVAFLEPIILPEAKKREPSLHKCHRSSSALPSRNAISISFAGTPFSLSSGVNKISQGYPIISLSA
jgi:hypothetical protein